MGPGTQDLPALIADYAQATAMIVSDAKPSDEDLVAVVLMRERVSRALASSPIAFAFPVLQPLLDADVQLRNRAEVGFGKTGVELLADVRNAYGPGPTGWWFDIGELAKTHLESRAWFWTALAGLLLTLSVSLTTDVAGRFLKNGPDFFGTLLTIIQASLAVVTGVAFTDAFWRWLDRVAPSTLGWGARPRLHVAAASATFVCVGVIYLTLPAIARIYNDYGEGQRSAGAVARAIAAFDRAIALDPDLAAAQYNLGSTYEMVHEDDRATSAYQAAVLLDPTLTRAQNNLARLVIIDGKRVTVALEVMDGLVKAATTPGTNTTADVLYAAYKNRGWAYLALKYPAAAAIDLRNALKANPQGASAYCLLAKAENDDPASAKNEVDEHWRRCIAFAPSDDSVLASWLEDARLHLKGKS